MNKTVRRVLFFRDICLLIIALEARGIRMMPYCFHRTRARQLLMVRKALFYLRRGPHQDWLAIDLVLIKNGVPVWSECEEYQIAGRIWEGMGGIWGGSLKKPHSIYHFQEGV